MTRLTCLMLAIALLAGPTLGAPATPVAAAAPARMFLSPSGEPFRVGPGVADPFEAWFDAADADHDGGVDRAEFRADAARFFKRLDVNGDGVIDGFELAAYEAKIAPELVAETEGRLPVEAPRTEKGDHGRRGGGGPPRSGIAQLLDEPEPVSGADFNLDGRITLVEWLAAADQRFDLLDTAKTGRLTREALKARLAGPAAKVGGGRAPAEGRRHDGDDLRPA
ncbi:MAG: hypothetical protein ACHP7N_07265 [Caulobacterales bacterium]